jgi:tetratricopeptide (TPR) repeat protein
LAGGESHAYRIPLASGQYLRVVVEQRGIDVVLAVFGPDGQPLIEIDNATSTLGTEFVSVLAEASGIYRLEVRAQEKEAPAGHYEAKVEELREATPLDKNRIAAERVFADGQRLRRQGTAESLRKAVEKYEEALMQWREIGDRRGEGVTLINIGSVYESLGENQKALEYYNQALPLQRATGDRRGEGDALNNIGAVYARTGQPTKALESFSQSLSLRQAVGDRRGEAETLNNIGFVHMRLGESQKALEYYNQALPLRRALSDRRGEAVTLNNLGMIYDALGEKQKALEYYSQSLPLRRAVGDRAGEARTLNNIASIYNTLGEKQKALEYHSQALPLRRTVGDRAGEAATLNNMGALYSQLGDLQRALDNHNQALLLSRATGDRTMEAFQLRNIGSIYQRLGQPRKALEYLDQALPLNRAANNPGGEAFTLSTLGLVHVDLGDKQRALDYYRQALSLWRAAGHRQGEANVLNSTGMVYADLGETQKARECFDQALAIARAVGLRSEEAVSLAGVARVERDRGHLSDARTHVEAALNITESLRVKIGSQELRTTYLASTQNHYDFYIDLLMRLHESEPTKGHDATALQASERARARSLLDILIETGADIRHGVDPVLLDRERRLQQQLSAKADHLTRLQSSKQTEEQAAAVEKELRTLLAEYQEVQGQIRTGSPKYAALMQPQPLGLKEIQEQVLDENTLLLEYALGQDRSYLWAVTPTTFQSFELPKRADIETVARRVYELLTMSHRRELKTQAELAAAELSQMVLGPVATQLEKKRLLIVSDGALQYIPFAALPAPRGSGLAPRGSGSPPPQSRTPNPQPLIADHEIVSLPSASVLAVLRRELAGRKAAEKTVAVLADPVFQSDDPRVRSAVKGQGAGGRDSASQISDSKSSSVTSSSSVPDVLRSAARESGVMDFERLFFSRQEADAITALAPEGQKFKAVDFVRQSSDSHRAGIKPVPNRACRHARAVEQSTP